MPSGPDNKIRSIKENPAGKVVADAEGNRWQWDSNDETAVQLKKLNNDELAIERTDIHPRPTSPTEKAAAAAKPKTEAAKPLTKRRDAGGGFNPYDNPGKSKRR
jgi:hypothetical protein